MDFAHSTAGQTASATGFRVRIVRYTRDIYEMMAEREKYLRIADSFVDSIVQRMLALHDLADNTVCLPVDEYDELCRRALGVSAVISAGAGAGGGDAAPDPYRIRIPSRAADIGAGAGGGGGSRTCFPACNCTSCIAIGVNPGE
jgi:hypothetical protein